MSEKKIIGYADSDLQENSIKIIINENFTERLPELSDYNRVIIEFRVDLSSKEKRLREIFGENSCEVAVFNLISVVDNEVKVERQENHLVKEICDIKPYYPEYDEEPDLESSDPYVHPKWLRIIGDSKNDKSNQFLC